MTTAYIVKGYRSAVGKANKGGFRFYRPDDLAADVIKHLLAEVPQLDHELIDDIIVGNAMPEAEQGLNVGRFISLKLGSFSNTIISLFFIFDELKSSG